jgi:hypothetical protein
MTGWAKQLIAIRTDPPLLAEPRWLATRQRKPYQALVHELQEAVVQRARNRHVYGQGCAELKADR